MKPDEDRGTGVVEHFPATDLEALYVQGPTDPRIRIRGAQLNAILGVTAYVREAWYVLDGQQVIKL